VENEDLLHYRYIHDAYGALPHKLLGLNMKNLVQTMYLDKKTSPSFCWFHTFYEKQIDAEKKYVKKEIKTNGLEKIQ
jgi:hypothetical protein